MFEFYYGTCVLTMYADDVVIYTCAATCEGLQNKLQLCVDKVQLQSLNFEQVSIRRTINKTEFTEKAKYLALLVKYDLSWDDHILQLCKTMN